MFAKYGEVDEISRSSDATNPQLSRLWVTYGSFREASAAIEALNILEETPSLVTDLQQKSIQVTT